jgi:hypothetical protein
VSHSKSKHNNSGNFLVSHPLLDLRICSHLVSFEPEFPILSFFLINKPIPFSREKCERIKICRSAVGAW